jgi:hypothetical protein
MCGTALVVATGLLRLAEGKGRDAGLCMSSTTTVPARTIFKTRDALLQNQRFINIVLP